MEGRAVETFNGIGPRRPFVTLCVALACFVGASFAVGWLEHALARRAWEEKHLPPAEQARLAIEREAGRRTNWKEYPERILDIRELGPVVVAELVADDSLTSRLARLGILRDSRDIFRRVFSAYRAPLKLMLVWHAPLMDRYGRESLGQVVTISMTRETAAKVVWENILPEDLPAAADLFVEHVKF